MKLIWNIIGLTALGLGFLGVVLPILPTTPFILLAAFAFGKSHPGLRRWLIEHGHFGPMIADWEANRAIAPKVKTFACVMMAVTFGLSLWLGASSTVLIIQAVALSGAALFVLSRPNGAA